METLPKNCTSIEEHFEKYHGKIGTSQREMFERNARDFMIAEMLIEERRLAKLTQEQLAEKTGTQKSLIARLERGKIEISTAMLNVLYQTGFGKNFVMNR